jgi:uncharacterized protein (TIGR03067 family)
MSRRIPFLALAAAVVWAAGTSAEPPRPDPKSDLGKIQGRWFYNRVQENGAELTLKGETLVTISGDKLSVERDGAALMSGTISLEPAAKPKAIDLKLSAGESSGKVRKGIYNYDGMTLTIVLGAPGGDRPTVFQTKPGDGWTGITLKVAEPKK